MDNHNAIRVQYCTIKKLARFFGRPTTDIARALRGEVSNALDTAVRDMAMGKAPQPINADEGSVEKIAESFGCRKDVVKDALRYASKSGLAHSIREAAISGIYPRPKKSRQKKTLPPMKLKYGGLKALSDLCGCSNETVRLALNGRLISAQAKSIRKRAVVLGLTRSVDEPLRKNAPKCKPLGFALRCGAITEIAKICNVPISFAYKVVRGKTVLSEKAEKVLQEASKPEYRKPDYSGNAPIRLEFNGIPKLAKEFGCSTSMVKKSLSWKTNTELAIAIRRKAEKMKEEADAICKQLKPLKVKKGAITTLAQVFGCHYNTAYFAINGLSKSDLCREIRAKAHEMGLVVDENNL